VSEGLVCLTCRRYIGIGGNVCECEEPVPSWDMRTVATDATALHEVRWVAKQREEAR
jgi:hypothetical protein